jgi:hypothetical protein
MNVLKLDFDCPTPPADLLERIRALFRWLGGRPAVVGVWRSNKKGWHVLIETRAKWARDPVAVVAAQAILGSDPKREMFNLMRAVSLASRPAFWRGRHRWNTFYSRKLQGG